LSHLLHLALFHPGGCRSGEVSHPSHLQPELAASPGRKSVRLFVSGFIFLLEALNPSIFQQPAEGPVKRAGAEGYAAMADAPDVLKKRVSVPRLIRQAGQNQENGF
jgi:hypothetical protein